MIILEIWKSLNSIQENGDYYEVSNLGNVRSVTKIVTRKGNGSYSQKGRVLKQAKNRSGYLTVSLKLNGTEKKCEVQRLVAKAFINNPDNKPVVNHKDSNTINNYSSNLEWVTQSENLIHARDYGNVKIGEESFSAKLKSSEVREVRDLYENKTYNLRELGVIYNISETGVWKIIHFKTHKNA